MITATVHESRRGRLRARVEGPILLLGNGERVRNLPMNLLPFRQDSSFLYFTGCTTAGAAALLDDDGYTLFLPTPPDGDELWHGPTPSIQDQARSLGADRVEDVSRLEAVIADRKPKVVAVADEAQNHRISRLIGTPLAFGQHYGDLDLVDAIIELRRTKGAEEISELRRAASATEAAFRAVMAATRPGATERGLAALFHGVLGVRGCVPGYGLILSVRGEVLHNHSHDNTLEAGQLLLLDGGGEVDTGYTVDITRTWPTTGRFGARQKSAYEAVLEAQLQAIDRCRPGVRYREVHDAASRVLATWLRDEGLIRCSVDEALESGAHGVFYPHGTGHHLGLDVHDLENFGDRPSYPAGQERPAQFGTRYLRLDLPLEPGWVVTVEPGFYVVPAILGDAELRDALGDRVNWDRAADWIGFGGIRTEDDVAVTERSPEVLTAAVPKSVAEIEALVGSGPTVEERLC